MLIQIIFLGPWFKILSFRPFFFDLMLSLITAVPLTGETWVFCIFFLVTKKHRDNFQITANGPFKKSANGQIFYFIEVESHVSIALFKCTECPTGTDAYWLPWRRRTALGENQLIKPIRVSQLARCIWSLYHFYYPYIISIISLHYCFSSVTSSYFTYCNLRCPYYLKLSLLSCYSGRFESLFKISLLCRFTLRNQHQSWSSQIFRLEKCSKCEYNTSLQFIRRK